MATITCGNCHQTHGSVAAVRACYAGDLFTCHWAVERYVGWVDEETGYGEGEVQVVDCGAEAIASDHGWTCAAGHSHVTAEARHAEGWDYAEEYGEAIDLARAGVEPRTMTGHVVTGPTDFAPTGA